MHYEPLRPHRMYNVPEKYEFTHGEESICVYDLHTLDFVKEIHAGPRPDCHATSHDNRYLYVATFDGLVCIDQEALEVVRVLDTGRLYATNSLPILANGEHHMLVHDVCGGVIPIRHIDDMEKLSIGNRVQVIPGGTYRCEIGGKGSFLENDRYYLCAGWRQSKLYLFDTVSGFAPEDFIPTDPRLNGGDDLVLSRDKTKAYCACHNGWEEKSHVAVIDVINRTILKTIETGVGTCGLTMTNDERYVIASNDQDDSISVIDTTIDQVVNTPCAREGFDALGIKGYIQGISCGRDDSIYVYGCEGNGALVRFFDVAHSNKYVISHKGRKYFSEPAENFIL